MGMYDDVRCKYPLPDNKAGIEDFQTKAFGDGFVGGFMDKYTITKEGELILHKEAWETVPEEERPYWGKPEWKKSPLMQICGSMRSIPLGDEVVDYHGIMNVYTNVGNTVSGTWYEYDIKFTDGKVSNIKRVNKEI
jgi:hypothetical protein